jgi:hypothetical protein
VQLRRDVRGRKRVHRRRHVRAKQGPVRIGRRLPGRHLLLS